MRRSGFHERASARQETVPNDPQKTPSISHQLPLFKVFLHPLKAASWWDFGSVKERHKRYTGPVSLPGIQAHTAPAASPRRRQKHRWGRSRYTCQLPQHPSTSALPPVMKVKRRTIKASAASKMTLYDGVCGISVWRIESSAERCAMILLATL